MQYLCIYWSIMKIIFESKKYYDAIWEIQARVGDKLKHGILTDKEDDILQWVSDLMCEELNERKLKHYWSE